LSLIELPPGIEFIYKRTDNRLTVEESPALTPGGQANQEFVAFLSEEYSELADLVPENCKECSTAWLMASRARKLSELEVCEGRTEITIEELTISVCQIPFT
jgi:hypothetical protein